MGVHKVHYIHDVTKTQSYKVVLFITINQHHVNCNIKLLGPSYRKLPSLKRLTINNHNLHMCRIKLLA
jgi:hypothetical protein